MGMRVGKGMTLLSNGSQILLVLYNFNRIENPSYNGIFLYSSFMAFFVKVCLIHQRGCALETFKNGMVQSFYFI